MTTIENTSFAVKAALIDRVVLTDSGTHPMKIIGVGNYCPEEDTIYLHLSSTTKFRQQRNGAVPIQYCGWFYVPHLEFQN